MKLLILLFPELNSVNFIALLCLDFIDIGCGKRCGPSGQSLYSSHDARKEKGSQLVTLLKGSCYVMLGEGGASTY
jgi:hypothetical protein